MIKKYSKIILINLIVVVVLVEIVSMIFIKVTKPNLPDYQQIPTYLDIVFDKDKTFKNVLSGKGDSISIDPLSPRNIDTLYPWCTWHPKNNRHREYYPCFDVTYKFNELGIRGTLPNENDSNTIIFVGDSYVEGFGLEEDSTLSERIHHKLNLPVLNLGTSGHFSPTQMSLAYAGFANKYKHKEVYVFFYLENDLIENNVNYHYSHFNDRYRPYRVLNGKDSSYIVYKGTVDSTAYSWKHFNSVKKKGFSVFPPNTGLFTKLTRLTYSRRCFNLLTSNLRHVNPDEKPYELKYGQADLDVLEKDIQSILETASKHNANVTFVNLPSKYLLKYSMESAANKEGYKALESKLKNMINRKNGRYLSYYDFLTGKKMATDPLFFPCDFHYSNYGEEMLSEFILINRTNKN